MQHVMCLYWTFLLTFYGSLRFVSSNLDSHLARSNDSKDSVDLLRLKLIAKRLTDDLQQQSLHKTPVTREDSLTSETLILIKSLASDSGTALNPANRRHDGEVSDTFIRATTGHTRFDVLKRYYRQSSGTIGNFQSLYLRFAPMLQTFVSLLSERLTSGAPPVLQYVLLIPSVLPSNDVGFLTGDPNIVLKKFRVVNEATSAVLANATKYVSAEYKDWYQNQRLNLNYILGALSVAALSLRINDDTPISLLSGGIASINTGVQIGISYRTLISLSQLVQFMVTGKYQTIPQ